MRQQDYDFLDNIPIGDMELSTRLHNVLVKHDIKTGVDVINLFPQHVRGWRGVGQRTINELVEIQEWLRDTTDRARNASTLSEPTEGSEEEIVRHLSNHIKAIEMLLSISPYRLRVETRGNRLTIIKEMN
jgi:hypothetical protein